MPYMNLDFSQEAASSFLEAYRLCMDDMQRRKSERFIVVPAVVCAAFSAEVGLKTILKREGNPVEDHDLFELFSKVSDDRKIAIVEHTGYSMDYFVAHLNHLK